MDDNRRTPPGTSPHGEEAARHTAAAAGSLADEAGRAARATGEELKQRSRETAHDLKDRGRATADRQRSAAAERLDGVSRALRAAASSGGEHEDWLGRGAEALANNVERAAGYLHDNDVGNLIHDLEGFARRRPEVFLGSALMAGVLAGRFLRSSRDEAPHREHSSGRVASRPVVDTDRPLAGGGSDLPRTPGPLRGPAGPERRP